MVALKVRRSFSLSVAAFFILFLLLPTDTFARDRDKNFGKGRGGPWRGNERSERPGRVPVGRPQWGGNGCPAGTMNVVFAPDNLSFTILFDQFVATAQTGGGQRRDVMTCDALIPIEIPANMQMEITRVDYRGFIALPDAQSRARLDALFNFRGPGGDRDRMKLRFDFAGPVQDNYVISTDLLNGGGNNPNPEVSPCGGQTTLRVWNQLVVQSRTPNAQAQATIDSIDGQANAVYYVNWRACSGGNNGGGNGPGHGGGGPGHGGGGGPGHGGGRH